MRVFSQLAFTSPKYGGLAFPKSLAAGMLPSDSRSPVGCPMEADLEGSPVREQALGTPSWRGGRGSSSLLGEWQAGLLALGGWFHPEQVAWESGLPMALQDA